MKELAIFFSGAFVGSLTMAFTLALLSVAAEKNRERKDAD